MTERHIRPRHREFPFYFTVPDLIARLLLSAPPGSSSLRAYPLLSVITRQPPHLPQVASPGGIPAASHLPLLSPQHPRCSEPSPSQTPLSISSDEETERSTPRLKKPRRSRTIFTEVQLMGLEKKFQKQKYLSTPDRSVKWEAWIWLDEFRPSGVGTKLTDWKARKKINPSCVNLKKSSRCSEECKPQVW